MSKLSQLQTRKLQEITYDNNLKQILANSKHTHGKKTTVLDKINKHQVRYYDFCNESGGEQLCFILQENNILQNDKQRNALQKLARTLLQKGWDSWLNDGRVVNALATVAKYEHAWQRDLVSYKPISHNTYRSLAHLLRYLFAQYPVPAFFDTAFYYQNDMHIRWYLHLARGGSVRNLDNMPLHLTQKMRHYFLQAPAEATIPQALRYAQVLGLGGSRRLASCVMQTRLSRHFENEVFWESVSHFLVQNPMMDVRYVNPIIDFLQYIKFEVQAHLPAPEPAFSMKARTVASLLRLVEVWEAEQKEIAKPVATTSKWNGLPLEDFEWHEGEGSQMRVYHIKQIRTVYALREEGRLMSHCVATYYSSCVEGKTSIWSMTCKHSYGNSKRVLTIELNNVLRIQQARGFCNYLPTRQTYNVMCIWAEKNLLRLSPDVIGYETHLHA